jgi:hypothetical protein
MTSLGCNAGPQINAHISDSPSLQGKDKSQVIMCENI